MSNKAHCPHCNKLLDVRVQAFVGGSTRRTVVRHMVDTDTKSWSNRANAMVARKAVCGGERIDLDTGAFV